MVDIYNGILFSFQKEGSLTHTRIRMNFEDIMLKAISQAQKDKTLHDGTSVRFLKQVKS